MMLVGWGRIARFLLSGYATVEWPGQGYRDQGEKMKDALMEAGIPVFFLPEVDTEPRAQTADLLKWMKSREAQRRAGTNKS